MRDAHAVNVDIRGMRRVEARHPWVWVRHGGAWRKGAIHCWFVDGDVWLAWMQHQPADPHSPRHTWALYAYDATTIRRRYPVGASARVEVPAAWGPARVIETRIRALGYVAALRRTGEAIDVLEIG